MVLSEKIIRHSRIAQTVYAVHVSAPVKAKRFVVTMVEREWDYFRSHQMLLLFHLSTRKNACISGEFVIVQCFEIAPPIHSVDRILNFLCLGWATFDKADISATRSVSGALIKDAEVSYGVVASSNAVSVHHIVRSSPSVSPFTPQCPWPLHRFNVNRFY